MLERHKTISRAILIDGKIIKRWSITEDLSHFHAWWKKFNVLFHNTIYKDLFQN